MQASLIGHKLSGGNLCPGVQSVETNSGIQRQRLSKNTFLQVVRPWAESVS